MDQFADPLTWLRVYDLASSVVSCEDAANAKGIPLKHELKSLVLDTDRELVIAHMPGDRQISLRAAKRALGAAQASLASVERLTGIGVSPGTVTPFLGPLWALYQLIDPSLLSLSWVSTNAGDRSKYIVFDPILLLRAERATLVPIVRPI